MINLPVLPKSFAPAPTKEEFDNAIDFVPLSWDQYAELVRVEYMKQWREYHDPCKMPAESQGPRFISTVPLKWKTFEMSLDRARTIVAAYEGYTKERPLIVPPKEYDLIKEAWEVVEKYSP